MKRTESTTDERSTSILPDDTTPAARRTQLAVYAEMTGADRLRRALELSELVLELAREGRRARSDDESRRRPEGDAEGGGAAPPSP